MASGECAEHGFAVTGEIDCRQIGNFDINSTEDDPWLILPQSRAPAIAGQTNSRLLNLQWTLTTATVQSAGGCKGQRL